MFARHSLSALRRRMARNKPLDRLSMLRNHLSTAATVSADPPVIFESDRSTRTFILNRPKLNPLDTEMIDLLMAKLKEWDDADLCSMIIGRGNGRAFCSGGNVKVVAKDAANPETRPQAIDFFRKEFHLDFHTAILKKPYIAILDGITMGGGAGLSMNAPFRVATEKTQFAMPETKIGYAPDVGASYFLSRLDGQVGTYLALTGNALTGRDVFTYGLATHYIPSRRVPELLNTLASLEDVGLSSINSTIDEYYQEPNDEDPPSTLDGNIRIALDNAFKYDDVDEIVTALTRIKEQNGPASDWADKTLYDLHMRSPTSLRIALQAIRRGRVMIDIVQALQMEFLIAAAFINGASPDFVVGVTSKLEKKMPDDVRIDWQPPSLAEISAKDVDARFFQATSPFLQDRPALGIIPPQDALPSFLRFSLPSEDYVESVVRGTDTASGATALTAAEVVDTVTRAFSDKHGVADKVIEILERKCREVEDPDGFGCVEWKS